MTRGSIRNAGRVAALAFRVGVGLGAGFGLHSCAVARAQAPTTAEASGTAEASARPGDVRVRVSLGYQGLMPWDARCIPVRVDVEGGAQPFRGVVRIRTDAKSGPSFELPVTAEAGSRRRLHETACNVRPHAAWEWSLDGESWTMIPLDAVQPHALTAVVGEDVGRLVHLETSMGWTTGESPLAAIYSPEDVPQDPEAWSGLPVVVVDALAARSLDPLAVRSLREHVASGGTLIVAGIEDSGLPEDLLAGRGAAILEVDLPRGDATVPVPALSFEPLHDASVLSWNGGPQPFMVARSFGAGRVAILGLDLRNGDVREALDMDAWRALTGISGVVTMGEVPLPHWIHNGDDLLADERRAAGAMTPVPPAGAAAYLLFAGVAILAGAYALGRRHEGVARRKQVALLLCAVAAPGFLLGLLRRHAAEHATVVIESWPQLQRARVVTWTPIDGSGETPLPAGATRAESRSLVGAGLQPPHRVRLGPEPSIETGPIPRLTSFHARTIEWREEPRVEPGSLGIRVQGGVQVPSSGLAAHEDAPYMSALAVAAIASGLSNGWVLLEPARGGMPRTIRLVHEEAP